MRSEQPRAPTAVTMFVIATTSRQHMLEGLCRSWESVISLAYFVGVLAGEADAEAKIAADMAAIRAEHDRWARCLDGNAHEPFINVQSITSRMVCDLRGTGLWWRAAASPAAPIAAAPAASRKPCIPRSHALIVNG